MERTSLKKRLRATVLALLVATLGYFALTDYNGEFAPPSSGGEAVDRIAHGFGSMGDFFRKDARKKNQDMQGVHDDYERRTDERVEESGGEAR